MYKQELMEQIFKTIFELVCSDGGDGTGIIFCTYIDYREVTKLFKHYIDNLESSLDYILGEYEGYDVISDRSFNENFIITSDTNLLKSDIDRDNGIFVIKI